MFRVLIFLALLLPTLGSAQVDTTAFPFKQVSRLRMPRAQQVDSMITDLKKMPGVKLDTICVRKTYALLDTFRNEDTRQRKKLTNQANSYAAGWREKAPGTCGAGGPPPICPVDHWYRAGVEAAMAEFYSIQEKALKTRLDKIWRALDHCITERPIRTTLQKNITTPPERKEEPGFPPMILQK
jgi:hypothetical protein